MRTDPLNAPQNYPHPTPHASGGAGYQNAAFEISPARLRGGVVRKGQNLLALARQSHD